jgi:uncharacterized protein (DUF169 family)
MKQPNQDLAIFNKFDFEKPPIGMKFLSEKPEGIGRLDKVMDACQWLVEAQRTEQPFYVDKENDECYGKYVLGMEDFPLDALRGNVGPRLGVYEEARVNSKIFQYVRKFTKGIINYVVFAQLSKLTFDPDLLIITANENQSEIIMRAMSYSTGVAREFFSGGVLGCSYFYAYPFLEGKVNLVSPGIIYGPKKNKIFPENTILISIPHNWIATISRNLQKMDWVLPGYKQ